MSAPEPSPWRHNLPHLSPPRLCRGSERPAAAHSLLHARLSTPSPLDSAHQPSLSHRWVAPLVPNDPEQCVIRCVPAHCSVLAWPLHEVLAGCLAESCHLCWCPARHLSLFAGCPTPFLTRVSAPVSLSSGTGERMLCGCKLGGQVAPADVMSHLRTTTTTDSQLSRALVL